eukprot:gene3220-23763_t
MAGRQMQRLQRLREEEAAAAAAELDSADVDSKEEEVPVKRKPNAFAMLMGMSDSDDGSDSDAEAPREPTPPPAPPPKAANGDGGGKKKKKKKKKKKNKGGGGGGGSNDVSGGKGGNANGGAIEVESEMDEIDRSLKEISEQIGSEVKTRGKVDVDAAPGSVAAIKTLLSIERRHLSADNEMRRMFGTGALRGGGGGERIAATGKDRRAKVHLRKTSLALPKADWPRMGKTGLRMEPVDPAVAAASASASAAVVDGSVQIFRFEHSKEYQSTQLKFLKAVSSMDPANISAILRAHPYHIDSLLQLSEVLKMQGDVQMAADFVERAIYCFELAFHTLFNVATGNCRLDYNAFENRAFFLSLFRHSTNVAARGCWRTAFEFNKLLLSLSPDEDPLSVILSIDFYALRACEFGWVKQLVNEWDGSRQLLWLPNVAYSLAYAEYQLAVTERPDPSAADLTKADEALQRAIVRFPEMVLTLAEKVGATLKPALATNPFYVARRVAEDSSEAGLRVLVVLYAWRAHALWKPSPILEWLQRNAEVIAARVENGGDADVAEGIERRATHYQGVPQNIVRHIVVAECNEARSMLPAKLKVAGEGHAHDPVPPEGFRSVYKSSQTHNIGALEMFMRSLVPGFEETVAAEAQGGGGARAARGGAADGGAGMQEQLANLVDMVGLGRLVEMMTAEELDDGAPLPQYEEPAEID